MTTGPARRGNELLAILLLCPIVGLMTFGLAGTSYLMPFIKPDLGLSNAQVGLLSSGGAVAFAASGALLSTWLGKLARPKRVLVVLAVLFGLTSTLPGLASTFLTFLLARMVMSAIEGPIMPTAQTLIALETPPQRRGMAMGIVHTLGNGLFQVVAPVLLVAVAERWGWQVGYGLIVGPALLFALLVALFLREPEPRELQLHDLGGSTGGAHSMKQVMATRNVRLCAAGAACVLANLVVSAAFLPFYLTQLRGLQNQQMGWLMTMAGLASIVLGIVLPSLSDRIGRRPAMIAASALGTACPLLMLVAPLSMPLLAVLLFFGWALTGASVLFISTVPSESVPADQIPTAIGLVNALSMLFGGVVAPALAGWSSDRWGFAAPVIGQAVFALLSGVLAWRLTESAPARCG